MRNGGLCARGTCPLNPNRQHPDAVIFWTGQALVLFRNELNYK